MPTRYIEEDLTSLYNEYINRYRRPYNLESIFDDEYLRFIWKMRGT